MTHHNHKSAVRKRMKDTGENYTTARRNLNSSPTAEPFVTQYARTNDPDILTIIRNNTLIAKYVTHCRSDFARKCNGQPNFYVRSRHDELSQMVGIAGDKPTAGKGQWKGRSGSWGWEPYRNHEFREEFDRLAKVTRMDVPGMPNFYIFGYRWVTPRPFIHDGYAWVGLSHTPTNDNHADLLRVAAFTSPWKPVAGSEYLKAQEEFNVSLKGTPDTLNEGRRLYEDATLSDAEKSQRRRDELTRAAQKNLTPMPVRAQYVRSSNPDVLNVVNAGWAGWQAAHERIAHFAYEHTRSTEYVCSTEGPHARMIGMRKDPAKGGYARNYEWAKDRDTKVWRPWKDSLLFTQMKGLAYQAPFPSGVNRTTHRVGAAANEAAWFMVDGQAWAHLDHEPGEFDGFGPEWEPATESDFAAAAEKWKGERDRHLKKAADKAVAAVEAKQKREAKRKADREAKKAACTLQAQCVRSDDPEVIAAVEKAWKDRAAADERFMKWGKDHGVKHVHFRGGGLSVRFGGFAQEPSDAGQWRNASGAWLPYKSNPVREVLDSFEFRAPEIPGVAPDFFSDVKGGGSYFMRATPFVQDGAAWVILGHFPTSGGFGPQWREVLASEARAAHAAWVESRGGVESRGVR